jgi:hypothetical protein
MSFTATRWAAALRRAVRPKSGQRKSLIKPRRETDNSQALLDTDDQPSLIWWHACDTAADVGLHQT